MGSRVFQAPPAVVVGHRGMGRGVVDKLDENTIASLLAAARIADWVELDVRRTFDDVLVVGHRPALPDGTPVAQATALAATTAGMPVLRDVVDQLPAGTGVNLDLKSALEDASIPPERTTAALLAPMAARWGRQRRLLVTSFDPAALGVVAREAPAVSRGLITWLWFPVGIAVAAAAGLGVEVLSIHVGSLHPNRYEPERQHPGMRHVVEVAHSAGLEVLAWCPDATHVEALLHAHVDALCVDDLPAMTDLLAHPDNVDP